MTNDRVLRWPIFLACWIGIYLLLVFIASQTGDWRDAVGPLAAVVTVAAVTSALAFAAFDRFSGATRFAVIAAIIVFMAFVGAIVSDAAGLPTGFAQTTVNIFSITLITLAVRQGAQAVLHQRRAQKAEGLRKAAEQRALNSRLSPHTLYNMLNAVYAASLKDPARASDLILDLSGMMRHLTEAADRDFVEATRELDFIAGYARLLQERAGQDHLISLDFPHEPDTAVPTLLCATLFENAVTHGRDEAGLLDIVARFTETEDGFCFHVDNRIGNLKRDTQDAGLNSGIGSIAQRLEYLFPKRHRFDAAPDGTRFIARIETW